MDTLKLVIQVMAEKINILEAEMNTVKRVGTHEEIIQEIKSKKEDTKINELNKTGIKNKDIATYEDKVKCNKHNLNKKGYKCDDCGYHCKKKSTLQKHMKSHHTKESSCDISDNAFKCNESIILHKDKEEKVKKNRSFVFSESMLDEFDPKQPKVVGGYC